MPTDGKIKVVYPRVNEQKIAVYEAYLQEKILERDWHGVIDMALELFELEILVNARKQSSTDLP